MLPGDYRRNSVPATNVQSAQGWEELLLPRIERQQMKGEEIAFRADAAFAEPEAYKALEEQGVKYAIRIPGNDILAREIEGLLKRPVERLCKRPLLE